RAWPRVGVGVAIRPCGSTCVLTRRLCPADTRRSCVSLFPDWKPDREPEATAAASSAMTHRARRTWCLAALAALIGVSIGVAHPAVVAAQAPGAPAARAGSVRGGRD